MKKTIALLLVCVICISVLTLFVSAETGMKSETVVNAAYGTPVVDGIIDAVWEKAEIQKYGKDKNNTYSTVEAGQFRVLWDETYIYILFEINDTTLMPDDLARKDTNWYKRDMVAVTFNSTGSHEATEEIMPPAFWYGYRPCGVCTNFQRVPANVYFTEQEGASATGYQDFTKYPADRRMYICKYTETGYLVEAKINLKARDSAFQPGAGKTISFDTWVYGNDYTAERTTAIADHIYTWADPNAEAYKDDSSKGGILLLKGPNKPVNPGTDPTDPTGTGDPDTPETGSDDSALAFMILGSIAVLSVAGLVMKKNRESEEQ